MSDAQALEHADMSYHRAQKWVLGLAQQCRYLARGRERPGGEVQCGSGVDPSSLTSSSVLQSRT